MYLYHVTFLNRLGKIQKEGIYPKRRETNLAISHRGPAKEFPGKVVFSDFRTVPYWMRRLRDIVVEDPLHKGEGDAIPVVLKIEVSGFDLKFDDRILPQRIQVWNGEAWKQIRMADLDDIAILGEEDIINKSQFPNLRPGKRASEIEASDIVQKYIDANSEDSKISKKLASYETTSDNACGECVYAYQHLASGKYTCNKVSGYIELSSGCDFWKGYGGSDG